SSLYAQYGLYATLKSSSYASVFWIARSMYRAAPYVSFPLVASRKGTKRLSSCSPGFGIDLYTWSRRVCPSTENSKYPHFNMSLGMPFDVARVTGSGFGFRWRVTVKRYFGLGGQYAGPVNFHRRAHGIGECGSSLKNASLSPRSISRRFR